MAAVKFYYNRKRQMKKTFSGRLTKKKIILSRSNGSRIHALPGASGLSIIVIWDTCSEQVHTIRLKGDTVQMWSLSFYLFFCFCFLFVCFLVNPPENASSYFISRKLPFHLSFQSLSVFLNKFFNNENQFSLYLAGKVK